MHKQIIDSFSVEPFCEVRHLLKPESVFSDMSLLFQPSQALPYSYRIIIDNKIIAQKFIDKLGSIPVMGTYKTLIDDGIKEKGIEIFIKNHGDNSGVFNCISLFYTKESK